MEAFSFLEQIRRRFAPVAETAGLEPISGFDLFRHMAIGSFEAYTGIRPDIETTLAKDLVKQIKSSKLKVQTAIQGDKLRVSGKKRDVLQSVIALLKEADVDLPLQYENFRD